MNPKPVRNKTDFVQRYQRGEFGNASLTWDSLEAWKDYRDSCLSIDSLGLFHIRNRRPGGLGTYDCTARQLPMNWYNLTESWQVPPDQLYISCMAPHSKNVLQGEVKLDGRYSGGIYLYCDRQSKLPMRNALREYGEHLYGYYALSLLRCCLCPSSYNWLEYLWEAYPNHTIEFSAFSVPWGTLCPYYNTVFWEVRSY